MEKSIFSSGTVQMVLLPCAFGFLQDSKCINAVVIALFDYLLFFLKGVIYSIKTHAEPPFAPQPFSLAEQPDSMLTLGVSEFTLNSASYAYYSAGLLQILLNDSMVRRGCPMTRFSPKTGRFFNTSDWF